MSFQGKVSFHLPPFYDYEGGSEWTDRGALLPCELRFEWAKLVNAGALIMNSPIIADFTPDDRPFHDGADYMNLMLAQASDWHDWFEHSVQDSLGDAIAKFHTDHNILYSDQILTSCYLYDGGSIYNTVAYRASNIVHESWHAWQTKQGGITGAPFHDSDKDPNGVTRYGLCELGDQCDFYRNHPKSAFGRGDLVNAGHGTHVAHSPIQLQFEFACDIADYSADWIPTIVREAAAAAAKMKAAAALANPVPPFCGSTRSYWTKDRAALADSIGSTVPQCSFDNLRDCSGTATAALGGPIPACGDPGLSDCSTNVNCAVGEVCEVDGCCRPACPSGSICDVDGCCRSKCIDPDPARQCTAEPFESGVVNPTGGVDEPRYDGLSVGHCAASGCDLISRCCSDAPPSCPPISFYFLAGDMSGAEYAQNSAPTLWSDLNCHYRGERWVSSRGATGPARGLPPHDFTEFDVPRLDECGDASRQCQPNGVGSFGCTNGGTCDLTSGCCSAVCSDTSRQCAAGSSCTYGPCDGATGCCPTQPTCPDPAQQCGLGSACSSGGCDLTTGCCSSVPSDCQSITNILLGTSSSGDPCGGQTDVWNISLSAWNLASCFLNGEKRTQSSCAPTTNDGPFGPIVCPRPGTTSGSFTCSVPPWRLQ